MKRGTKAVSRTSQQGHGFQLFLRGWFLGERKYGARKASERRWREAEKNCIHLNREVVFDL